MHFGEFEPFATFRGIRPFWRHEIAFLNLTWISTSKTLLQSRIPPNYPKKLRRIRFTRFRDDLTPLGQHLGFLEIERPAKGAEEGGFLTLDPKFTWLAHKMANKIEFKVPIGSK